MKEKDPILKFRSLDTSVNPISVENEQIEDNLVEGHTMITKTREAADSSEHTEA